jgi:hypothetical protein
MISSTMQTFLLPQAGDKFNENRPWRIWFALLFFDYETQITPSGASREMN